MEELRFDGQVAVVTGGGNGLGRAYALLLASRGARVVVNDLGCRIDGDGSGEGFAQAVVEEIIAAGGSAVASLDSVAEPAGGAAIVDRAIDTYGRIDILIHNAGILRDKSFHNMDLAMFDAVIDVHLRGGFNVAQPAYRRMREAGYGRIIMTSSASGLYGNFGQVNYSAAKAGLIGMTRAIALEGVRCGVTANVIVPAAMTRMTADLPQAQAAPAMSINDVSPVVAWLAHSSCPLTGETLIAIGGRVARAYMAETVGVLRQTWTLEDVACEVEAIRAMEGYIVPHSPMEHMQQLTAMLTQRGE